MPRADRAPDKTHAPVFKNRGPTGRNRRSLEMIKLDAQAAELFSRGWSYARIAEGQSCGWSTAYSRVQRGLKEATQDTSLQDARAAALVRVKTQLRRLDVLIESNYYHVGNTGKIVMKDGEPLQDKAPVLAAIRELRGWSDREAKLLGLDAPTRSRIEIVGREEALEMIDELEAESDVLEAEVVEYELGMGSDSPGEESPGSGPEEER